MKFAHIADTHIRNLKYHKEYRDVFAQLYKKLKEENVDCMTLHQPMLFQVIMTAI